MEVNYGLVEFTPIEVTLSDEDIDYFLTTISPYEKLIMTVGGLLLGIGVLWWKIKQG